jgi:hypothetical protein
MIVIGLRSKWYFLYVPYKMCRAPNVVGDGQHPCIVFVRYQVQIIARKTDLSSVVFFSPSRHMWNSALEQWYLTFFVRVPSDIISLQLCTPEVVGT